MEDEERDERAERFSKIWWKSRAIAGKSQEYMALSLGVSKKTIRNWEKGVSSPTLFQSAEWFKTLGLNPIRYYLDFLYPDMLEEMYSSNDEKVLNETLHMLIDQMSPKEKKQLLYLIVGDHGSSWYGLLEMFTAHLHTTLKSRVTVARTILDQYEMELKTDHLVCPKEIQPDLDKLKHSIEAAKDAVSKGQTGYTIQYEEDEE